MNHSDRLINTNQRTAIIYSLDELFIYVVKIHQDGDSYYVCSNGHISFFTNIEEAIIACRKYDVEEAYLATSNICQDFDPTESNPENSTYEFDYEKVLL